MIVRITVNGDDRPFDVSGPDSLLSVLRRDLGLPGTKDACEQGECGSCTVELDGALVCSCLVMAVDADGCEVTTVEGLGDEDGLHPVQEAMLETGAVQCGFCTPGFVVAGAHLLDRNPHPTPLEVKEALAGNVCRCTGYGAITRAFELLAEPHPGDAQTGEES
ncbi:MAG: (2Fe-2S)-binding protein [Acidimicrobiia bacterium]|nr:(2Fe-2S)-binding protein [Acidimicrobiia bacterium]